MWRKEEQLFVEDKTTLSMSAFATDWFLVRQYDKKKQTLLIHIQSGLSGYVLANHMSLLSTGIGNGLVNNNRDRRGPVTEPTSLVDGYVDEWRRP